MPQKTKHKEQPVRKHLVSAKRRRVRGLRNHISDVRLEGMDFTTKVRDLMSADLTRTIEGASSITITMHDEDMKLLRSHLMDSRVDIELDGLWYRSVALNKQGKDYTWTFEDREVALMRQVDTPRKVLRDQVTRAEFVYSQVQEVKKLKGGYRIPCYIPEIHKVRPIASTEEAVATTVAIDSGDAHGGQGIDRSVDLTVKGVGASPEQIHNGETVLQVGSSMGASPLVLASAIVSGIQENNMTNADAGSGCRGYFCIIDSTAAGLGFDPLDLAKAAESYFGDGFGGASGGAIQWAQDHPGDSAAEISSGVEVNQAGASDRYQWEDEAAKWVEAFSGGGLPAGSTMSGTVTQTSEKEYEFERKKGEDAWDSTGRLAEEVKFRRYMSAGVFYYLAETQLLEAKPLMYIDGDPKGIDSVDFTWDQGRPVQEVEIAGRVRHWAAPPGTLVKLNDDYGPAKGRYIVSTITSSLLSSDQFTATLVRPTPPLPEPAPETSTKTSSFGETGTFAGGIGGGSAGDIAGVTIPDTNPGPPSWGGTKYIFNQLVNDVMTSHGCTIGATKEFGHSETGDHPPTATTSYACDFGTTSGEGAAMACGEALGISGYHTGDFTNWQIVVDGHHFRVQILWAVPDHYDHVHVGIRLNG